MCNCPEIERELGAFAGGELAPKDRERIDRHLEGCTDCREELAREKDLGQNLGSLPKVTAPVELESRLQAAIQAEQRVPAPAWKRGRLAAAALAIAACLTIVLVAPALLRTPEPQWSDQEIAAARQDVMYTLGLTVKIIDRTRKEAVVDVFADKLPRAIDDSFKMAKPNNSGGNG